MSKENKYFSKDYFLHDVFHKNSCNMTPWKAKTLNPHNFLTLDFWVMFLMLILISKKRAIQKWYQNWILAISLFFWPWSITLLFKVSPGNNGALSKIDKALNFMLIFPFIDLLIKISKLRLTKHLNHWNWSDFRVL